MAQQDPGIFTGGQMTDLPSFPNATFDGTELLEIVAPGNRLQGVNYGISTAQMARLLPFFLYGQPTFITDTYAYNSVATDTRILVNQAVAGATSIVLGLASSYGFPVLVKDLKGDADTNPITVTFTGGETLDGLSQVVINNPFGYFWFNPLKAGNWYDAAF